MQREVKLHDEYFVELEEANEAIKEVVKELSKKPIVIKTLNTRVDTARDLVLKLLATTEDMIRTAKISEWTIVYGNRYRSLHSDIQTALNQAQDLFLKGDYKTSLAVSLKTLKQVDENIEKKVLALYGK